MGGGDEGVVWFGLVWFGLVWFGLVWFGLVWFGLVWFGLVWFGLVACAALIVWLPAVLAFPCFLIGLLASPLCGAGTYFSLPPQREVSKRKRLTPLILKWVP
ncbi:hypothetical protein PQQ52_34280, partial [Paraburkholderia sediminicola]